MEITKETVKAIAKLARLDAKDPKVVEKYQTDLAKIIGVFQMLEEVDTTGIQPLVSVSEFEPVWRKDEVTDGKIDNLFSNAPSELYQHFAVPKVIE